MRKLESTRAAESVAAKKGKAATTWAFFQKRILANSEQYNAFSEGKEKKNFSAA